MALRNRRNGNLDALQAFAAKFDPPLPITETRAVAGKAVTNGYMTAWHDPESGLGLTAVVWGGGRMKVWVEVDSEVGDADSLGEFFADVVKAAVPQPDIEAEEKAWDVQLAQAGQRSDLQAIASDETCQRCGSSDFIATDDGEVCGICGSAVRPVRADEDNRQAAPAGPVSDRMEKRRTVEIDGQLYYSDPLIQQDMEGASSIRAMVHPVGQPYTWKENRPDVLIVDDAGNVKDEVWNQPPMEPLTKQQWRDVHLAEFPNPQRIDMTGLTGSERLTLCSQFPALRFRIDADGRKRVDAQGIATPDDGAGFCTAEQLAHVRRLLGPQDRDHAREPQRATVPPRRSIPRMPAASGGVSAAVEVDNEPNRPMHALPKASCAHEWIRNSIGDGMTCRKCQGFQPINPTRANAARRNEEDRLRDMLEQAAICIQKRGRHFPVTMTDAEGRVMRVCQFCGADVPEEPKVDPEAPVAS